MSTLLENITSSLPEFAKDLKLNLSSVLRQDELTPTQLWGTVIAAAYTAKNVTLTEAFVAEASEVISAEVIDAAKAAAAIMGMNNIYYRFLHLVENESYSTIPARLRMNVMRTHKADPLDFELWSLAVSAINGCAKCIVSHERVLRSKGIGEDVIAAAVRVASVVSAVAGVNAMEGEPVDVG